jgi:pyruvate/2-oxoglutarate dehydrogenase complex dihydrolipoamide dehydrogenase (E3) component
MGHDVTLLEKTNTLGGHFQEAVIPPFKTKTGEFFEWLVRQVKKGKTKIILNANTSAAEIKALKPDLLLIAVGSTYLVPAFAGKENVVYADKALFEQNCIGKSAIVIGGGLVGCETALTLAENKGCDVTIVEMLPGLNMDTDFSARMTMLERIEKNSIKSFCSHKVEEILPDGVICADPDGNKKTFKAESVIIAMGLQADEANAAQYENLGMPTVRIGDCKSARTFAACTEDAWRALFQFTGR